ncbi:hypothetical protein [Sphingobacterium sp. HMA12]|uniref:TlpA family protein disulfide reductase n=1 Tax=Sphingobacterium sp. HMA12 TaxID=2050894 RepID=UPI000CE9EF7C|nr:hypothetical protein [Sphingobacterium sp. HMA12]
MNFLKVIAFLWIWIPCMVFGQVKPLKIGDTLDYNEPLSVINWKDNTLMLDSVNKDLIIFDFFTTSCTSCIEAMPKNNKLQQRFAERLQIIPVGIESKERIGQLLAENRYMKDIKLPLVVEEKVLTKAFPHQGVPHVVWIFKGRVVAITTGDMIAEENIKDLLNGNDIKNWPMKDDFYYAHRADSISSSSGLYSRLLPYENGAALNYKVDTIGNQVRYRMTNATAVSAFLYLYSQIKQLPLMKKERIQLHVNNLYEFENLDSIPESIWMQKNAFSYESTWPLLMDHKDRILAVVKDLSNRLELDVDLTPQKSSIWLVKSGKARNDNLQNGKSPTDLKTWITMLEIFNTSFPPIEIDNGLADRVINTDAVNDFESLRKVLKGNGLDLKKTDREILSLVIRSQ